RAITLAVRDMPCRDLVAINALNGDFKIALRAIDAISGLQADFVLVDEHETKIVSGGAADRIDRKALVARKSVAITQALRVAVDFQISLAVLERFGPRRE